MAKTFRSITRRDARPPASSKRHRRPTRPRSHESDRPLPRALDQQQVSAILRAAKKESDRDLAMLALMYRYALRPVEVTMMLREDVNLAARRIRITRAQHRESKEYVLAADLVPPIKRYLRRRIDRGPYLFTGRQSTNQTGLTVLRVQQLFKHYAQKAGLSPNVASHALRHSMAVHAREAGYDLPALADLLGHRSLRSTEIYAQVRSKVRSERIVHLAKSKDVVHVP
jgi:integrase/recombinase XerD